MEMKINQNLNIIIDTDPGTDDALALGTASVFLKDNIRAVISSYGNVDGERAYCNLVNLAGILKINTKIIKGSLNPSADKNFAPTDYHGENGLCGIELPAVDSGKPYHGDFLRELYDIIKQYGDIKYTAIGPLTNLALLLGRFPDASDYISEAVIMGGGFEVSNMPHNTEYNFSADPAAVKKVFESSLHKVIAPLDMTHKLSFSLTAIEDITGVKRELLFNNTDNKDNKTDMYMSDSFTALAKLFYLNYDTAVRHGEQGAIIHDASTLAYILDKSKCRGSMCKIVPDEYGAVKRYIHGNDSGYPAFVIDETDRDFMRGLLKEVFNAAENK